MKRTYLFLLLLVIAISTGTCDRGFFVRSSVPSPTKYPVYALNSHTYSISKIAGERDEIVSTIKLPDIASTFAVIPNGNLVVVVTGKADMLTPYKREILMLSQDSGKVMKQMKLKYIPDDMYIMDNCLGVVVHNTELPGKVVPLTLIDFETQRLIR